MGYTPGDIAPRDGEVYCRTHTTLTAHVKKGERFPPPSHHKNVGGDDRCEWEYRR